MLDIWMASPPFGTEHRRLIHNTYVQTLPLLLSSYKNSRNSYYIALFYYSDGSTKGSHLATLTATRDSSRFLLLMQNIHDKKLWLQTRRILLVWQEQAHVTEPFFMTA